MPRTSKPNLTPIRKAIIQYLEARADAVSLALNKLQQEVQWLANRTGTVTGLAILDVRPPSPRSLRHTFDTLALVWSGTATRKPRWIASATSEMINHVRNNMFHGQKDPDDVDDRELLKRVNRILLALLEMDA